MLRPRRASFIYPQHPGVMSCRATSSSVFPVKFCHLSRLFSGSLPAKFPPPLWMTRLPLMCYTCVLLSTFFQSSLPASLRLCRRSSLPFCDRSSVFVVVVMRLPLFDLPTWMPLSVVCRVNSMTSLPVFQSNQSWRKFLPNLKKWSQNIPGLSAAILAWWHSL